MHINARLAAVTAMQKCTEIVRAALRCFRCERSARSRRVAAPFVRRQLPATPHSRDIVCTGSLVLCVYGLTVALQRFRTSRTREVQMAEFSCDDDAIHPPA